MQDGSLLAYCLYFGLAGGMLAYVSLLNVVVRDRGYLLYAGHVAAMALGIAAHTGVGAQLVWGEWRWWESHGIFIGYGVAGAFSVALTRHFLHLRENLPPADALMGSVLKVILAATALSVFLPAEVTTLFLVPMAVTVPVLLLGLGTVAVLRRWPGAPYFVAAWAALHGSVLLYQARHFGIVPDNTLTANLIVLGSALQMILMSLALADRINDDRRKREVAQGLTLGILRASQVLASGHRLEALGARVCDVMARMTGSSTVRLALHDVNKGGWFLYGADEGMPRLPLEDAARQGLISLESIADVQRTLEPVANNGRWLLLPALHRGNLSAVLILENSEGKGEFAGLARDALEAVAGPLAVSIESALLYERLEDRVAERTRELRDTQQELVAIARRAGMAEVATNVLHNVGNTLNSVNVAAQLLIRNLAGSRVSGLARTAELVEAQGANLGSFVRDDPRGRALPAYLKELAGELQRERADSLSHLEKLTASVDHIKGVVAVQQAYVGSSLYMEVVAPAMVVDDALRIADMAVPNPRVEVLVDIADMAPQRIDKTRVLQILVNLMTNARQAMGEGGQLTVRVEATGGLILFTVADTGHGIEAAAMDAIFSHGFTTRRDGHGFGLHSSATAARQIGGELTAKSEGLGKGALFTLELPVPQP